jgi:four helix bundle protein
MFSLTSQIRRAAISIPSNIAEGRGRSTRKDFVHFLYIAKGSLSELETQLFISKDLQLLPKENFDVLYQKTSEIGKLLHGIINKLKAEN